MTHRRVIYVAHCLRPNEDDLADLHPLRYYPEPDGREKIALCRNVKRAKVWRDWLRSTFAEVTFVAPWIGDVAMGDDDSDPAQRERGMRDNCALITKLDGVVLCGPRISAGMAAERDAWIRAADLVGIYDVGIYDLTSLGATPPPADMSETETFEHWASRIASDARPLTLDDVWCHGCTAAKLGAAGPCRKHGDAP